MAVSPTSPRFKEFKELQSLWEKSTHPPLGKPMATKSTNPTPTKPTPVVAPTPTQPLSTQESTESIETFPVQISTISPVAPPPAPPKPVEPVVEVPVPETPKPLEKAPSETPKSLGLSSSEKEIIFTSEEEEVEEVPVPENAPREKPMSFLEALQLDPEERPDKIKVQILIEDFEEFQTAKSVQMDISLELKIEDLIHMIGTRGNVMIDFQKYPIVDFTLFSQTRGFTISHDKKVVDVNIQEKDVLILRRKKDKKDKRRKTLLLPSLSKAFVTGGDLLGISGMRSPDAKSPESKDKANENSLRRSNSPPMEDPTSPGSPDPAILGTSPDKANQTNLRTSRNSMNVPKRGIRKISLGNISNATPAALKIKEPLLEGYLNKKNKNRRYKKRWIVLDAENLYCFKSPSDPNSPKVISLLCAAMKMGTKDCKFEVVTPDGNFEFVAENEKEVLQWTAMIDDVCHNLVHKSIGSEQKMKSIFRRNSTEMVTSPVKEVEDTPIKKELKEILALESNQICADCGEKAPEWASTNLGVFVCINCSGVHRSMGTHITKMRSVIWDDWDQEQVQNMRNIGNYKGNLEWEATWDSSKIPKPTTKSSITERAEFIRAKYERREFRTDYVEPPQGSTALKKPPLRISSLTSISYDDKTLKASASALRILLNLYWEDGKEPFTSIEVADAYSPLAGLREQIAKTPNFSLPSNDNSQDYMFSYKKAPVSQVQEQKAIKDFITFDLVGGGAPTLVLMRMNANDYNASA